MGESASRKYLKSETAGLMPGKCANRKLTNFPPSVGRFASALSIPRLAAASKNVRSGNDIKWMLFTQVRAHQTMAMSLSTEVRMIKGVGPQRAELLAQRGIYSPEDLLGYLPFRYEDRIHFSRVKDIQPNGVYTIRARVMSGQAVRSMRGRDAIYHLLVQDDAGGSLPCKFFHGGYLQGRVKPRQLLILHGKAEVDKLRPGRLEMIHPPIEVARNEKKGSTQVG